MKELQFQWLHKGFSPSAWRPSGVTAAVIFSAKRVEDIFAPAPKVSVTQVKDVYSYERDEANAINLVVFGAFDINPQPLPQPKRHEPGDPTLGTDRAVYQYIGPSSGLPFRAGLTVHTANGTWSSTPHDFEREGILSPRPMPFWEQFAYITYPSHEWGVQVKTGHLDGEMVNTVEFIRDRDIKSIPLGSHPVSGGPGVRMAYFWVYTAEDLGLMEKFED